MATPRVTIDQLPIQAAPEDTNEIIVQDAGVTKRLTIAALLGAPSPPLADHIAAATDAHDATAVSAAPSGTGVDGANVQLQLGQLATIANGAISQATADARYVNLDGDTMTAPLVLPAAAPTLATHAANKQYVDDSVAAASEGITQAEADLLYVNVTGDNMTGPLLLAADPGSLLEAATKQYVDAQVGAALTQAEADPLYVNVAGDTMTGLLTADGGVALPVGEPSGAGRAARKDYVDAQVATALTQAEADALYATKAESAANLTQAEADPLYVNVGGDTMTGLLTANGGVALPAGEPSGVGRAARKDYIDNNFVGLAGDTMTGALAVGATPGTSGPAGVSIQTAGRVDSTLAADVANLYLARIGPDALDIGDRFISLWRAGTQIGTCTIASTSSVAWNTTSDQRLKERTGDVADAADLVQALGRLAYRGRWIADEDQGEEWVFINSQDVEPVAPYAVTGAPDGVVGADDPEGRTAGEIVPQQLDHGALVPLLTAALSQALDRIQALEGAIAS